MTVEICVLPPIHIIALKSKPTWITLPYHENVAHIRQFPAPPEEGDRNRQTVHGCRHKAQRGRGLK